MMNLHRNRFALATIFLALSALAGCGKTNSGTKSSNGKSGEKSKSPGTAKHTKTKKKQSLTLKPHIPPKNVTLTRVTPKELEDFVARHKGQVVLVDYWATYCAPCLLLFPHTVELSENYAKNGLVVVSVCVDINESFKSADAILKKHKAHLINFFPSDKVDPDNLDGEFGIAPMPEIRIYGPDGKLAAKLNGPSDKTAKEVAEILAPKIDAAVEKALGFE